MNPQPNRFFHLSLIFLVALNLLPHWNDHSVPTIVVGGFCLVWRLLYEYQKVRLPNDFVKAVLVMALSYLVYENYGQILGLESGSALLICAVSLKLIDRVDYRDAMVLLFLNFMLLLARFFESQSLGITLFAGFDLVITTALLVQLHNGAQVRFDIWTLLKTGSKLVLQVAPVMVLLFFVFPRFSTGFLSAPSRQGALDGFSNTLEPGSLTRLAQTDQLAFHARFKGEAPALTQRYWRGGVLTENQNMKWLTREFKKNRLRPLAGTSVSSIAYEILVQPVFNDWIFTLDRGVWVEPRHSQWQRRVRQTEGSLFRFTKAPDQKLLYEAQSVLGGSPSLRASQGASLFADQRALYLQTPSEATDPRVRSLVQEVSKGQPTNEEKAQRLMQFYSTQFRYTLSPGRLKTQELAEFLFEKRVGFCEHFAVSFAALMRLADVPSRVVVGFHGGRRNKLSDYYRVSSKDAHAWTEIWSDTQEQWLRFDPTTLVAPLRFELGGEVFHSLTDDQRALAQSEGFLSGYDRGWWQQGFFAADALATQWNLFLLKYDQQGQKDFFAKLGLGNLHPLVLFGVSILVLVLFFLWLRSKNPLFAAGDDSTQRAYLKLQTLLEKKGIQKKSFEGPSDFLIRAQKEDPTRQAPLESFRKNYLATRYGLQKGESLGKILKSIR